MNNTNLFNTILSSAQSGTTETTGTIVSIVDALLIAVIGIALVFAVLGLLMFIIWLMGVIVDKSPKLAGKFPKATENVKKLKGFFTFKKKAEVQESINEEIAVAPILAEGSCGELRLINTTDRDAVMIMAIIADETETPLNELRFKYIKKLSEGEDK